MFGSPIEWGYHGSSMVRDSDVAARHPTDRSAEVLYPRRIDLARLQRLYVPGKQHRRLVRVWAETYGLKELPVEVEIGPFS